MVKPNHLRSVILSAVLFLITSAAWSDALIPRDLKLFPEPRLSTFLFGGYEFDKRATIEHYDQLFAGKTATEIVRFLEIHGYHIFYDSADEIGFYVINRVVFFDYSARIGLKFEDDIFLETDVVNWGVK